MTLAEASRELGCSVVDCVETSAAESQDSVDILLATAIKVETMEDMYIQYYSTYYSGTFAFLGRIILQITP